MGRMFKAILVLLLAAVLGTLGYAYFGEMTADPVEIRSPVALPDLAPAPAVTPAPAAPAAASPAPQAPRATGPGDRSCGGGA
ncbi:hypothetical protein ACTTAL_09860 [Rhodobacter capsulatus]|uniref:hypothetical protein n=1 Tax=Rhodobacter capsulatus TaxID=1061 RepID=UPI004038E37A